MATVSIRTKSSAGTEWTTPLSVQFADRIVHISGPINTALADEATAQLDYLAQQSDEPIMLIISSPGGMVSAGLAIVDFIQGIAAPVRTHAIGMAASMAAVILACGEPGFRTASPHTDVLIHQPMTGGISGQASDIALAAQSIVRKKEELSRLLSEATGKAFKTVEKAVDRDNTMTAKEAMEFGLIDRIEPTWRY